MLLAIGERGRGGGDDSVGKPEGGEVCEAADPPGIFAGDAQWGDGTEGSRCKVRYILTSKH